MCLDSQMLSFTHYRREDVTKVRKNPVISKLFFNVFHLFPKILTFRVVGEQESNGFMIQ